MNEGQEQPPIDLNQAEPHPEFEVSPEHKSGISRKRLILVICGVILLGGIGFAAALVTSGEKPTPNTTNNQETEQPAAVVPQTSDIEVATTTKSFKSDFPRIEFTYPENWKVTENKEQEGVRIESPDFKYSSVTGIPVNGNFRIYIRQGARQQDSKIIGRGVAAQASEKLIYKSPAPDQRPETNLSFFGLDTSDNFAYFLIAGNFSLQKNETLGPEYGTEPDTYIITGGYSSNELAEDMATNPVPIEYFSTTNAYKQAMEILKSLKIL